MEDLKAHWENVYKTKSLAEVSWYQPKPRTSLDLITNSGIRKNDPIIDVGGGDSLLADHLLELGYTDITVLDVSEASLKRAQERLGDRSKLVSWIASDAAEFRPARKYALWHDRAVFHFFTDGSRIEKYLTVIRDGLIDNGNLVVGTFSESGPKKCSGLEVKQYSEDSLSQAFARNFTRIKCLREDHRTPFGTVQNFVFCGFKKADGR